MDILIDKLLLLLVLLFSFTQCSRYVLALVIDIVHIIVSDAVLDVVILKLEVQVLWSLSSIVVLLFWFVFRYAREFRLMGSNL